MFGLIFILPAIEAWQFETRRRAIIRPARRINGGR
jgi:hypothetical protein